MANTNIDLVGLDFASLKNNLKTFLKTNTQFKDLDYEGSNINVLLDVLAYNSYLNAFYTNMVASEMFLDTAQLRDSIVSHAKELNYLPRSFTSSKATINVKVTPSGPVSTLYVPKNTSFTSRVGSNTFTFVTNESYVLNATDAGDFEATVDVYEGPIKNEAFVVNYSNTTQRFVISNPTVDISSLEVTVYEDGGQTVLPYVQATQLYGVTNTTNAFFIQAAQNQQYELVFGDGVYGRKPKDGSTVVASYRACSGELPNGASVFSADGPIDGETDISITTVSAAAGGAVAETIESIRYNAPRLFQTQNRAVTARDYETLLKNRFSDIVAISAYGGEEVVPPRYGQVFIAVDVANADGAPLSRKAEYLNYIKDKTPLTMQVQFVDPTFLYLKIDSTAYFDVNSTTKTTSDIETSVRAAISTYNINSLSDFKKTMYYSAFVAAIDGCDRSMLSNDTNVRLIKRITPALNTDYAFSFSVDNKLSTETGIEVTGGEAHYGHTLTSTAFTYQDTRCVFVDDSLGTVYIASEQGNEIRPIRSVGTIDYDTGLVSVGSSFNISAYEGNYIQMIFETFSKNILSKTNTILVIDPLDVDITVVGVKQ